MFPAVVGTVPYYRRYAMQRRKWVVLSFLVAASFVIGGALIPSAIGVSSIPKDAKYVGTKACRKCHTKEYKVWAKTKHGTNFEELKGDQRKDPKCVKCHTTGYGKPGGFTSEADTPELKNTGCEACHGPGSAHAKAAKDAPDEGKWEMFTDKTPQNACVACHNPHINHDKYKK